MLPNRLWRWNFALVLGALLVICKGATVAQEGVAPPDDAAAEAATPDDAKEPRIREQTIYVPYEKLRHVFEKEGRGVFLPYERFRELWEAARERTTPAEEKGPPIGAVIAQADSEATVQRDVVSVVAQLKIEILAEGWHEIPIRLADAAIRSATVAGQPAHIVSGDGGYKLLVKNDGKEAREIEVRLEYVKAFTKSPGQNSVAFQSPQAPVNRWTIRIPESGVKVNVSPMIAATEVPVADVDDAAAAPDAAADDPDAPPAAETVVLAFVGAAPTVRIDWTPKSEGATGLAALATVRSEQEVRIDEGVMRTRARLVYEISRADLPRLTIEVPADQKVVNVYDPNIRQWDVNVEADKQTIDVQLFEPIRGTQKVTVDLERVSSDLLAGEIAVPVIRAVEAGRQQGSVVVALAPGLQAEVTNRSGLMQVDRSELPSGLRGEEWAFAYRYAALPFDLDLQAEKSQPKIRTDELVEVYVEPERLSISLLALYTIERAGVFQLQLQVPAGFEVREVRGHAAGGAEAAAFDSRQLSGEDKTQLTVNLSQKAFGKVGLLVELERRLNDANLLRPTGEKSQIAIEIPRVDPTTVEQSKGRLVVYKPDSLRVVPAEQQGVSDAISLDEVYQQVPSVRNGRFPTTRAALTFAYTEQPASVTLAVERRKPHVTARQLLVARIESGVVKYEAKFVFDILYSGVKALRIDVPAELASEITNRSKNIQEELVDPTKTGGPAPPPDYVAWLLTGETELIGQVEIAFSWEKKLPGEFTVGTPQAVPLPYLRPAETNRDWGRIVIAKAETIDVRAVGEPKGLRMIDPQQDLEPNERVEDAALAFEFHEDWQLDIQATRYELTKVKRTSIERAVVRMAATLDGELIVQALYRLRSARQRVAVQLPNPDKVSFDSRPLWINGRPVALEEGDGDAYFIPLVGQAPDDALLLELRYTVEGGPSQLELPVFPDDPPVAVQKVFLCAYLPQRLALLGASGPWTDEMQWQWRWPWRPMPYVHCAEVNDVYRKTGGPGMRGDRALVMWVTDGVSVDGDPFERLSVEGTPYVYSTLRPAPPPEGALRLRTIDRNWLNFLVFAIVAGVGLLMVARPLQEKLAAIIAGAIGLVLCGVFLPTLTVQLLGDAFGLAVILVILLWLVAFVLWQTRSGRSFLANVIRGRQPRDVVVSEITPPPSSAPAPAAMGEAPTMPLGDRGETDSTETEGKDEADKAPPADEKQSEEPNKKQDTGASNDDQGPQPEGGRTDA